jgi:transcriptional regulator with XRE-family HTH domain
MHLGTRIKIARISKGLTQEQLAEKINKTRPLISGIEQKGVANYHTLKKICDVLGVDMDYLNNVVEDQEMIGSTKKTEYIKQLEKEIYHLKLLSESQADLITVLKEKITGLEKKSVKK